MDGTIECGPGRGCECGRRGALGEGWGCGCHVPCFVERRRTRRIMKRETGGGEWRGKKKEVGGKKPKRKIKEIIIRVHSLIENRK